MTSKITVSAHCAPGTHVVVLIDDETARTMKMELVEDGESKDYFIHDYITVSAAEVRKYSFNSEVEAMRVLESEGVTLDSNRWMDWKTAPQDLSPLAICAAGYLCTRHGFVVNT